jgi:cation:H+ antiporter
MEYILLLLGFVFLIKGADMLVKAASSFARKLHLSEMIIGLTIVSFGTSLPELIVTITASFNGKPELGLGNVLGSNVANILFILGIAAIVRPLPIPRDTYFIEIPFSLLAAVLLGFLANTALFGTQYGFISRYDGLVLLYFFALFMVYVFVVSRKGERKEDGDEQATPAFELMTTGHAVLWFILGIGGLFIGGRWIVNSAATIAERLGFSEAFIGLTILAIGTSLPELVTSAVAAYRNNTSMAVGNAIGSNIFNILWIIGLASTINPIAFKPDTNHDILMIIISTSTLIMAVIAGKRAAISRWEGGIFLIVYVFYIVHLLNR